MIKLSNVSRSFRNGHIEKIALRGVSIEIPQGEYISIHGPSGSGKSTLLSLLALLDSSYKGCYLIDGVNVKELSDENKSEFRRNRVGYVSQDFHLFGALTVIENILFPMSNLTRRKHSEKELDSVKYILDMIQFPVSDSKCVYELSRGEQQLTCLARALVKFPEVLFLDEPTANLDSKCGDNLFNILDQINENGTSIILVTHCPKLYLRASRQIELIDGRIIEY